MRIAFYAPMKPPDHPLPSGDRTIARVLIQAFLQHEHAVEVMSRVRARYAWLRPLTLIRFGLEGQMVRRRAARFGPDLWLTYHTYYKAPDLLGPHMSKQLGIPYFILEGSHSPRRWKSLLTRPGFYWNRRALLAAVHVFANKKADLPGLLEILPQSRISYVPQGIDTRSFRRMPEEGSSLRQALGIPKEEPVVCTAAMLRPGRKAEGVRIVIDALAVLRGRGVSAHLLVAGDGAAASELRRRAEEKLGTEAHFLGRVAHDKMVAVYSASDVFAFPGIRESMGMVYLEAQAAGLPVLAYGSDGRSEVIQDEITGIITPAGDESAYADALERLIKDADLRLRMREAAVRFVEQERGIEAVVQSMQDIFSVHLKRESGHESAVA